MKSELRITIESDQDILNLFKFLNPTISISQSIAPSLEQEFPVPVDAALDKLMRGPVKAENPYQDKVINDFVNLKITDVVPEKQESFKEVKPAVDALIAETFKPGKLWGICATCQTSFPRLHNRVKWCDKCRSDKAIAEAAKKGKRSAKESS